MQYYRPFPVVKPSINCLIPLLVLALVSLPETAGWSSPPKQNMQYTADTIAYKNPVLSIESRVDDLLQRMTLEEKFWQLFMIPSSPTQGPERYDKGIFGLQISTRARSGHDADQIMVYGGGGSAMTMAEDINRTQKYFMEKTRLGIPIIPFDEGLHGLAREGATVFPQAIALAATWDPDCMGRVAEAIAEESKSRGIRQILSPVVNLARDVRWGRVEETYGEDPFLAATMALAFVDACERNGVITTPKHFVVNSGDGGRDSYPIHASERILRETYFPVFKTCFEKGGSRSVMTAYNSLDGTPCTSSNWLLNSVLKGEWDFRGFVVSDAGAVGGLLDLHHTATNRKDSAAKALNNGLDVIFQSAYEHHIPLLQAFQEGMIPEATIDASVARVLRTKFELGLFENPYTDPMLAQKSNHCPDHIQLALEAAEKSLVLLKNEASFLPVANSLNSIAVIGPDAKEARLGGYSGPGLNKISIFQGIQELIPEKTVLEYCEGCGRSNIPLKTIPQANFTAVNNGEVTAGLKGEYFQGIQLKGSPCLTRIDPEIQFKWNLFSPHPTLKSDWFSARWTGKLKAPRSGNYKIGVEGNDGFRLFLNGRKLIDRWTKQTSGTALVSLSLNKGTEYDICLEFNENRGNGTIRLVWDYAQDDRREEAIREAVQLASRSSLAVVVAGIVEGEFQDRANLGLPGLQEKLIRKVAATGTPTVVVLIGGSAITMTSWMHDVDSILLAWYPGERGGQAIAETIFGKCNPAGRLPVSFPRSAAQLPLFYNHKPTGRGDDYINTSGSPLFPFGFGLSYTTFEYADLEIAPETMDSESRFQVSCSVTNTGCRSGQEVVQLYFNDQTASVARPVAELIAFKRIALKAGEKQTVFFEIPLERLSLLDRDLKPIVEAGAFSIMVGASSRDIRLRGELFVESQTSR